MSSYIQIHNRDGGLLTAPAADRQLHTFRYRCTHVPTGDVSESENLFVNFDAFVTCLERWNQQAPNIWRFEAL